MFLASQTAQATETIAPIIGQVYANAHASSLLPWIVLLPLFGAIINGLFRQKLSEKTAGVLGSSTIILSFLFSVIEVAKLAGLPDGDYLEVAGWTWMASGSLNLEFALLLDHLSAVMLLIVTGVGSLIHIFSTGYMRGDKGYGTYFSYLNLFVFAMLLLVLGKNLMVLFVGWEGVGLASYLLIGYWYDDMEKAKAGQKAFIANRIGDVSFLIATFLLLFYSQGSVDFVAADGVMGAIGNLQNMAAEGGETTLMIIALLYLFAATGKSAQLPLYVWLPDAMAGPTPVSALMHAATMVTAGVYLMARMNPLFGASPEAMTVAAYIGGATALFAATIALVQNDIKKVLAYSTVSQIGYMVLAIGVGSYVGAIFHLMTHAFFKACLFLGSGSVIHAMDGNQDMRTMGGLRKKLPVTNITFFVSCLAIAGVPFFAGFFSKDEILFGALSNSLGDMGPNYLPAIFGILAAIATAFYMFRAYYLTFGGEYRGDAEVFENAHEESVMNFPLLVLGFLAVFSGFLGLPHLIEGAHFLEAWLAPNFAWLSADHGGPVHALHIWQDGKLVTDNAMFEVATIVGSVLIALFGWLMARRVYNRPTAQLPTAPTEAGWYRLLSNKYYVDEIYGAIFIAPFRALARFSHKVIDQGIIDGIFVRGPAIVIGKVGDGARKLQNGDTQAYVTVFVVGLAALLIFAV